MIRLTRRAAMAGIASLPLLNIRRVDAAEDQPPILFLSSGPADATNGYVLFDRFTSNGYDPGKIFSMDFLEGAEVHANEFGKPHPGRSTQTQHVIQLAARVDEVKRKTGADKIVLIGQYDGGLAIRNYIKNANGFENVSIAILCSVPNHGHYALDEPRWRLDEMNGNGYFLRQLNFSDEATPGVRWLTIRSDKSDPYFQPMMSPDLDPAEGHPNQPSKISYDSPALDGATNVVLPGADGFETVNSQQAFREMFRFITGREPARLDIVPEDHPVLNGRIFSSQGVIATGHPLEGTTVEIYEVSPETGARLGPAVHRRTTGADAWWGPFTANPKAFYEFVIAAPQFPVNHLYTLPFQRSSNIRHYSLLGFDEGDQAPTNSVIWAFSLDTGFLPSRDKVLIDGVVPKDFEEAQMSLEWPVKVIVNTDKVRTAPIVINKLRMAVQTWPSKDNHLVAVELRGV